MNAVPEKLIFETEIHCATKPVRDYTVVKRKFLLLITPIY